MSIRVGAMGAQGPYGVCSPAAGASVGYQRKLARTARIRVLGCLLAMIGAVTTFMIAATPAGAASFSASHMVALIPARGPTPPAGQMPIAGPVAGVPGGSYDRFTFVDVPLSGITPENLKRFDTVALIQLSTAALSASQRATLTQFVLNGGKLLIHDSDETSSNDYSWLPYAGRVGAGCPNCGATSGTSTIIANNGLISSNPSDPSYVDLGELAARTDGVGDANLFVTLDPHWVVSATGTNANGDTGATVASATDNGLVIYNGYDTDYIRPSSAPGAPWLCRQGAPPAYQCPAPHSGIDWLGKMWYEELAQGWGSTTPGLSAPSALAVGGTIDPATIGAPANARCLAVHRLSFSFRKLHARIKQADVYINGRHVLRTAARRISRLTVGGLPSKGAYTLKIILTNQRGYHLITRRRYVAC